MSFTLKTQPYSERRKAYRQHFEDVMGQAPLTQTQTLNLIYIAKNIVAKARQVFQEEAIPNAESFAWNAQRNTDRAFLYHRDSCDEATKLHRRQQKDFLEGYQRIYQPLFVSAYAKALVSLVDASNDPKKLDALNLDRKIDNRWLGRIANQFIRDGFEQAAVDRAKAHAKAHTQRLGRTGYKRSSDKRSSIS
jgi:hypothetical protein